MTRSYVRDALYDFSRPLHTRSGQTRRGSYCSAKVRNGLIQGRCRGPIIGSHYLQSLLVERPVNRLYNFYRCCNDLMPCATCASRRFTPRRTSAGIENSVLYVAQRGH
jgi:hypothetical protein